MHLVLQNKGHLQTKYTIIYINNAQTQSLGGESTFEYKGPRELDTQS